MPGCMPKGSLNGPPAQYNYYELGLNCKRRLAVGAIWRCRALAEILTSPLVARRLRACPPRRLRSSSCRLGGTYAAYGMVHFIKKRFSPRAGGAVCRCRALAEVLSAARAARCHCPRRQGCRERGRERERVCERASERDREGEGGRERESVCEGESASERARAQERETASERESERESV